MLRNGSYVIFQTPRYCLQLHLDTAPKSPQPVAVDFFEDMLNPEAVKGKQVL